LTTSTLCSGRSFLMNSSPEPAVSLTRSIWTTGKPTRSFSTPRRVTRGFHSG
jgi:hypothetical protein